ncbi:hypothetical protein NHH73_02905 [Oxalobacteraceae bacterium OTU3CINTB1]|nr:hypothetical protein NHH73_02905 [Oxalobacteraceae bacterium OTU3CINTB1]
MPAIGQETGSTFLEADILNPVIFAKMRGEQLHDDVDANALVVPVRNKLKPHFRVLAKYPERSRTGKGESNETHTKAIDFLLRRLKSNTRVALTTYVFGESIEVQTIYKTPKPTEEVPGYHWWSEARIPVDSTHYIQPDICGRGNADFMPNRRAPGIIIEVIQTHYPDEATFIHLLALSRRNFFVLFYFVRIDARGSKFSGVDSAIPGLLQIRSAYWLDNGVFFKNGEAMPGNGKPEAQWYREICALYFDKAMASKNQIPPKATSS